MSNEFLYQRLEMLPDDLRQEAADFIDFLFDKAVKAEKVKEPKPKFGTAKGKIHMTEDFDAPMDDFKEYM